MREYDDDDNIRLYTPVLQRIIILVAVIIAVPVVMWTITTFVRTYVAPPTVPTFVISVLLAVLALFAVYGHIAQLHSIGGFTLLLIAYVVLLLGTLLRGI